MNFDAYAKQKSLISPIVQKDATKPAEGGEKTKRPRAENDISALQAKAEC